MRLSVRRVKSALHSTQNGLSCADEMSVVGPQLLIAGAPARETSSGVLYYLHGLTHVWGKGALFDGVPARMPCIDPSGERMNLFQALFVQHERNTCARRVIGSRAVED